MSFILKILEKLLDRHIRGGVLVEKPLHRYQFVYRAGMSTKTALFHVVYRLEKSLKYKEVALGAFLDIEGAFDNTSFNAMVRAARRRGLGETCCRWIRSMLVSRLVHDFLTGSSLTARVAGGCPQGGVLSPLLWNLVVDELLAGLNDQGLCAMGYADDIVIIAQGKFTHTIRELMQAALNEVVKCTTKEGLSISPQMTVVIPFTNKRNIEGLGPLILLGKQFQLMDGVFLDSKLN
jgi:RNase P protein component